MEGTPRWGKVDEDGYEVVFVGDGFEVGVWYGIGQTSIRVAGEGAHLSVQEACYGYYIDEQSVVISAARR